MVVRSRSFIPPRDPERETPASARLSLHWQVLHTRSRQEKAVAAYERAFQLEPTNSLFREKAGDIRKAILDDRLTAAKADGDEEAIKRVGAEMKEFLVEEYQARVAAHPTELALHFQLGKALYANGDIDGAIKLADQAKRQGENGYAQGVAEKDAGFPDYVK